MTEIIRLVNISKSVPEPINYFLKNNKAVYLLSHNHNDKIYLSLIKGESMAQQLSQEELASFKELLIAGMIEIQNKLYQRQAQLKWLRIVFMVEQ